MSIFNPFVSSCQHERNLDWILKMVKGMPQKKEMESALEEVKNVEKRAAGMVEQVQNVIGDATAAAKEEIRRDLSELVGRVEDAERNTLAKATEVQTAIDNATYIAKIEVQNFVNTQLEEIRRLAEAVSEDSGYVEQVVTDAASAIKNQIAGDIDNRFAELETELDSKLTKGVENATEFLSSQNAEDFNTHKKDLSTAIGEEFTSAKGELNDTIYHSYLEKARELVNYVDNYVPNAVASAVNQRFATRGVFIPVNAWSNKIARVDAGINVEVTSLFVTYSPQSFNDWYDCCVRCVGASGTELEFACDVAPSSELYVYVVAVENIVYRE